MRRSLTRSSKNLLERLVMAEVRALPIETSAEIGGAPSMRWKPSRKPPSSSTAIDTFHLFLCASAVQALTAFSTSAAVRQGLSRMGAPRSISSHGFMVSIVTLPSARKVTVTVATPSSRSAPLLKSSRLELGTCFCAFQ
jgi:hypothetical protein